MVFVEKIEVENWNPNFERSGQISPKWSRLSFNGIEICNAAEWIEWSENPVQLILCDACGYNECASGGYANISEFGNYLLFTKSKYNEDDKWEIEQYSTMYNINKYGGFIVFKNHFVEMLNAIGIKSNHNFTPTLYEDVLNGWAMSWKKFSSEQKVENIIQLLNQGLLASDTLDPDTVISIIQTKLKSYLSRKKDVFDGRLIDTKDHNTIFEKLYFNGPKEEDWIAIAKYLESYCLVLSDRVLITLPK